MPRWTKGTTLPSKGRALQREKQSYPHNGKRDGAQHQDRCNQKWKASETQKCTKGKTLEQTFAQWTIIRIPSWSSGHPQQAHNPMRLKPGLISSAGRKGPLKGHSSERKLKTVGITCQICRRSKPTGIRSKACTTSWRLTRFHTIVAQQVTWIKVAKGTRIGGQATPRTTPASGIIKCENHNSKGRCPSCFK